MRERVSSWLARGIALAAFLAVPGFIDDPEPPVPSRLDRALALVRDQDFSPVYSMAAGRIDGYFREMREREFLDEIFSLSGKWKAVTRSRESYERFVRKTFEKHLLHPENFNQVLQKIRDDYAFAVASSENRLLAALYEDFRTARPGLDFPSFRAEYASLTGAFVPCVLEDLGMNGVTILGTEAATVVLMAALTSAGIVGGSAAGGAAAGWRTFGVGLGVGVASGLIIDGIVGGAWEEAAEMQLRRHLNSLRWSMIDAVRGALARALEAHRRLQEACVLKLYKGGRDGHLARGR